MLPCTLICQKCYCTNKRPLVDCILGLVKGRIFVQNPAFLAPPYPAALTRSKTPVFAVRRAGDAIST